MKEKNWWVWPKIGGLKLIRVFQLTRPNLPSSCLHIFWYIRLSRNNKSPLFIHIMIASQGQNNSLLIDIIPLLSLVDFRLLNHSQTETGHLVCSLAHQSFHPSLWHTIPILSFTRVSPSYSSLKSGQDEDAAIGAFLDWRTSCHSVFSRAI